MIGKSIYTGKVFSKHYTLLMCATFIPIIFLSRQEFELTHKGKNDNSL